MMEGVGPPRKIEVGLRRKRDAMRKESIEIKKVVSGRFVW
jgi:hypothetical protein